MCELKELKASNAELKAGIMIHCKHLSIHLLPRSQTSSQHPFPPSPLSKMCPFLSGSKQVEAPLCLLVTLPKFELVINKNQSPHPCQSTPFLGIVILVGRVVYWQGWRWIENRYAFIISHKHKPETLAW